MACRITFAATTARAKKVRSWLERVGVKTLSIEPGSPWENGYIESFNSKLRDELLNREIFDTMLEAKVLIASWRVDYNTILVPLTKKTDRQDPETGETASRFVTYGFKHAIVYGFEQTDGEPLPPPDPAIAGWIDALPLVDVARCWGLSVEAYNGRAGAALGKYRHGSGIALGVENLSTWAHELVHAADDRLGRLTERGQHWRSETVAELGGAVLLEVLGHGTYSDRGGCWGYVRLYARDAGIEPITACQRVLKRTCDTVALILDTAEDLAGRRTATGADAVTA